MENEAGNKQVRAQTILRKIAGIFNKVEGDFSSLKEYNDYLKDIMDMTTKLIEGKDVSAIEEKIHKYENENAELIQLRRDQKHYAVHGPNEGASVSTKSDVHAELHEPNEGASVSTESNVGIMMNLPFVKDEILTLDEHQDSTFHSISIPVDSRKTPLLRKNKHLLRSGRLGMCNDLNCNTLPTYFKDSHQRKPRTSTTVHPKLHNSLQGDIKSFGRKLFPRFCSCNFGVMNPHTRLVQLWNKFLVIICILAIFVDPLFFFLLYVDMDNKCIKMDLKIAKTLAIFRSIIDVVYFLNIFLQLRLAYISPESTVVGAGDLVDHPKKIAFNYFKKFFLVDLVAVLPLPQIMILFVLPNELRSPGKYSIKNMLCLGIFAHFLPRLIRYLSLIIGKSPTGFIFESAWANFIINLLIFMLFGHFIGSCWYLFGLQRVNHCLRSKCNESHLPKCTELIFCKTNAIWINHKASNDCFIPLSGSFKYGIYGPAVPLTIETNVFNRYLYAHFWGFQQISTLAGNQTPSYFSWEVLFTMFIIGSGLLLIALLIGNIQNFLQSLGRRRLDMQLRGRDVEKWMNHRCLPEDLKRRVRKAERYSWEATRGVPDKMFLENLPDDLQIDIRRHLFKFVKRFQFFSLMDENEPILDAFLERLVQKTYIEGSKILSQGGFIHKMLFIVCGKLESIGEDGISVPLSEGDACGEELLIWYLEQFLESKDGKNVKPEGHGLTSDRTVRCLTNVEAFSLRTKDIEEVTTLFAGFLQSPRVQGVIRNCQHACRYLESD